MDLNKDVLDLAEHLAGHLVHVVDLAEHLAHVVAALGLERLEVREASLLDDVLQRAGVPCRARPACSVVVRLDAAREQPACGAVETFKPI